MNIQGSMFILNLASNDLVILSNKNCDWNITSRFKVRAWE
jgi:hypothetical protein